ncbi:unnamed protein product [Calicophoron daubneyi]|uniref:RING-type domain-containing protein n=1 Tax=Calicophoron daubneyi TaxID=300641 RepID=A0AAV2TTS6_CALDB
MVELTETFKAVERLLELLRCDSCHAPLHQPFTTGVCEHLLCPNCSPGQSNLRRAACCPVCKVPVHPRDCQLHVQLAELVLVARRLKKLTTNSAKATLCTSPQKVLQETDLDAENDQFKKPASEIVTSPQPRIILKRSYSSGCSTRSLPSRASTVVLKRGLSADCSAADESASLTSSAWTQSSLISSATSRVSVIHKPRLNQSRTVCPERSKSKVVRLPAYRSPQKQGLFEPSRSVSDQNSRTVRQKSPPATVPASDLSSATHGVNSDSLEMVLRAATRVHRTRRSICNPRVSVTPSLMDESVAAPVASPENSCVTDSTILIHSRIETRNSTVNLDRINFPADEVTISQDTRNHRKLHEKTPTRLRSTKAKKRDKNEADRSSSRSQSRTRSSSGFLRLVQKMRPNSKGESSLHRAAIRGDVEQVHECLASGISPNVRDYAGWTPLHEAVLHGHREVVLALLDAGATIDIPGGPDLDTPLHDSIQNGQVSCCELLLSRGANPFLPNGTGLTPLQMIDVSLSKLEVTGTERKRGAVEVNRQKEELKSALLSIQVLINSAISSAERKSDCKTMENPKTLVKSSALGQLSLSTRASFLERRKLRPVLLATGLNRTQQATFARVASMIHAKVVDVFSPEVTHVITGALQDIPVSSRSNQIKADNNPRKSRRRSSEIEVNAPEQAHCPRTLKFLDAVLQGCWVLSFDWIETCAHVKMRVEEEGFEVSGCSTTPNSGAPRRARLAREAGSLGLFHGFRFCFLGRFTYPVPSGGELATLVRYGGASVVCCRERCSPRCLARLAIEMGDSTQSEPLWEINDSCLRTVADEDDVESDGDKSAFCRQNDVPLVYMSSPLLVVYDPRQQPDTCTINTDRSETATLYPIRVVSTALNLIQSRSDHSSASNAQNPPIRAFPATWILDCAAEYTLLPFPPTHIIQ